MNLRKPLIIAGNGPSIKDLDYSLFPKDFDVFRCNQFYFEDKYYLGKEVKGVFFNACVFDLQMKVAQSIVKNSEYHLEQIYCTHVGLYDYFNNHQQLTQEYLDRNYVGIRSTYSYLKDLEPFFALHSKYRNFYNQHFTSGIMMLIVAIALGYKEIYLCGIDFYENSLGHFYEEKSALFPVHADCQHSKSLDFQAIELAKNYAKIYALVPNSALAQILPLSSQKGVSNEVKERLDLGKEKTQTTDYFKNIPNQEEQVAPKSTLKSTFIGALRKKGINESNFIFLLLKDSYYFLKGFLSLILETLRAFLKTKKD
ncbi:alpha-2,3-sialyltransferase [Helicobacter cetorum]|uniref:Bifunctional alpha-2,3/-2,8-sialyltransferase n=1 Tax=Helicobacter cetorum (strain ATCC BAA-429 / MIT 00-7128) TaxID=182217 RepID=I0EP46_HELC0|nr:alpha-2,3-sialyltransferase [Helicobacter cetorum]AFI04715.1 bifunctional alpha-2,3/-2,8-sialyltransferase [Helicobacter cetorum MIT 00-7128]